MTARKRRARGLVYKLVFLTAVVVAASVALASATFIVSEKAAIQEQTETQSVALAQTVAAALANAVVIKEYAFIIEHCMLVLKTRQDLRYIIVIKRDGKSLVHTAAGWRSDVLNDPISRRMEQIPGPVFLRHRSTPSSEEVFEAAVPITISGSKWGVIRLGFSVTPHQSHIARMYRTATGITGACLLLGVLAALLLTRTIARPIGQLTDAVRGISEGLPTGKVAIATKDEIGELSATFNHMIEALERTTISRDYFDNVLSSMTDCLIVVAPDRMIKTVNRETLELLGFGAEADLVGQPIGKILGDGGGGGVSAELEALMHSRNVQDLEVQLRAKDGTCIPVLVNGAPMLNKGNAVQAVVLVARDLREIRRLIAESERLAAEKEKAAQLAHAYQQLSEAHRELRDTQAKLLQSGRLASIGELAAGVAHEMNNPLSAVLTYAILLNDKLDAFPEELRLRLGEFPRQLKTIRAGAERCKTIADNLLAFSRQGEGGMEQLALHELVTRTFELIGARLRKERIKLQIDVPAGLTVHGNGHQLQQVLTNLALNATQAMGESGELRLRAFSTDRRLVTLEVTDNGPGIKAEHLDKIFDPFFTTKPVGQGTGLGLSIVYGIIQKHRGEISVESTVGVGTTFRIQLPATAEEAAA